MNSRRFLVWLTIVPLAILGCGTPRESPPGTGAKEAAAAFFDAIARQQWQDAFDRLDAASRTRLPLPDFTKRAVSYRKKLGFEPAKVHVRLCEEQGATANAHVVIFTADESQKASYRDAVPLRKGETGWEVALPANFGMR